MEFTKSTIDEIDDSEITSSVPLPSPSPSLSATDDDDNTTGSISIERKLDDTNPNPITLQRVFKGHKKSVTCLDHCTSNNDIIASGSDDHCVRIWDTRTGKCSKCIMTNDSIDSISFSTKNDNMIYVACGNKLKLYDLRSNDVIISQDSLCLEFTSDINAICINQKGQYLAISDDTGSIIIIDILNDHKIIKRLCRVHSNLVSAISFRYSFNSNISSGGFDCTACTWDINTGRPLSSTNFSRQNIAQSTSIPMINPPFVQSIKYSFSGKVLVCGLGDGTIRLLNPRNSVTVEFVEAHGGTITCMSTIENDHKNLIISGGIDKKVKCWEILEVKERNTKNKKSAGSSYNIVPLWSIDHNEKVNAIIPMYSNTSKKVYVTDIGNNIWEYVITP